jgi:UDPglucose 6-dehydrogenase
LSYSDTVRGACVGAHLVLVLTEWAQYRDLEPESLLDVVATPSIVDGRNCLDPVAWTSAGWTYRALGRPLLAGRAASTPLPS